MEREAAAEELLLLVALGDPTSSARAAMLAERDPRLIALAALTTFFAGDGSAAYTLAEQALDRSCSGADRALTVAAYALASTPLTFADTAPAFAELDLLVGAMGGEDRWSAFARYAAAEAGLADARLSDAQRYLDAGPPPHLAWDGHPYADMMRTCAARLAAFTGNIDRAREVLGPADRSTPRIGLLIRATDALILGNAAEGTSVRECVESLALAVTAAKDEGRIERGTRLLAAFGLMAVGEVSAASRLALSAGDTDELTGFTVIDKVLAYELLLAAAAADTDADAAHAWLHLAAPLQSNRAATPTVLRMRSRLALLTGEYVDAVTYADTAAQLARHDGRAIESAEAEILLARAGIAAGQMTTATRRLRTVVTASDSSGHRAVRVSASQEFSSARRRLLPVVGGGWAVLSPRESEIARLILQGHDHADIASDLFLSAETVRTHTYRILAAFGVASRIGLIAAAGGPTPGGSALPGRDALTPRQQQVAAAVAAGMSNVRIAADLAISTKAVEKHVSESFRRWRVESRFQLALHWWRTEAA